jgi:hypothetical protein
MQPKGGFGSRQKRHFGTIGKTGKAMPPVAETPVPPEKRRIIFQPVAYLKIVAARERADDKHGDLFDRAFAGLLLLHEIPFGPSVENPSSATWLSALPVSRTLDRIVELARRSFAEDLLISLSKNGHCA